HHDVLRADETGDVVDGAVEEPEMRWLARDAGHRLVEGEKVRRAVAGCGGHEEELRPRLVRELEHIARQRREEELPATAGDDASGHRREASPIARCQAAE